jgi:hypothetical protein
MIHPASLVYRKNTPNRTRNSSALAVAQNVDLNRNERAQLAAGLQLK